MKTNQVIHIFALKSRGNKTSDINFNDILSKILIEFHVSQMINEIYLKGKCPIKANYKTTCAMLWLLFQLWYLFCVEKNVSSESCDWTAPYFSVFLRKKKKKTERVDLEKCRRQAVLIITSSYTRLRMTQWTHLNTLNVPGISKYLSHAERRTENNASIYFTGWVGWWGGEKCAELPLPSPLTHIWHERDKGIT